MTNKKTQKLDKFAKFYDTSKDQVDDELKEYEKRHRDIMESLENELGPTIFYDDRNSLMKEYEALTNQNRIKALEYLTMSDSASLTKIAEKLGTSAPTTRKHLEILENAGMIGSTTKTTKKGRTRIFFAKRKLVKRGKEEEILRQRKLRIDDQDSFIFRTVEKCALEIAKSNDFREYIKAAKIDDDWEISDALENSIKDALNGYIYTHTTIDLVENNTYYELEFNFEILAAVDRLDLIDKGVEDICEDYVSDAIYDDKTKEEVLDKIDQFLEKVEKKKEEVGLKLGGENVS